MIKRINPYKVTLIFYGILVLLLIPYLVVYSNSLSSFPLKLVLITSNLAFLYGVSKLLVLIVLELLLSNISKNVFHSNDKINSSTPILVARALLGIILLSYLYLILFVQQDHVAILFPLTLPLLFMTNFTKNNVYVINNQVFIIEKGTNKIVLVEKYEQKNNLLTMFLENGEEIKIAETTAKDSIINAFQQARLEKSEGEKILCMTNLSD